MKIFITGINTDIGKTLVSSWLCLHTGYHYFKPIQTGSLEGTDSQMVKRLSDTYVYPEVYLYKAPLSPYQAAALEQETIDLSTIYLPLSPRVIIEGAGGVLVPLNQNFLMIDLIKQLNIPVLIVASTFLGSINHTLLTIEALKNRSIEILGIITSGKLDTAYEDIIKNYGKVSVLGSLPLLSFIKPSTLQEIPLGPVLSNLLLPLKRPYP